MTEVHYIYENIIVKPTKNYLKGGRKSERG
jgi:hypothetical protein